ncbi:MAG: DUF4240 domain-containing protein [Saprospiraceae bacterium]|nr:DUF4240 domain-containing protein [Saprospiraceae bacterium]
MTKAVYHLSVKDLKGDFIHDLEEQFGDAPVELVVGSSWKEYVVSEDQFWDWIKLLDWTQLPNEEMVVEKLVNTLAKAPIRHIYDFYDMLSEKLYALDSAVYAVSAGLPAANVSADHFLDIRSCVVANGKEYYHEVLNNPEKIPRDTWFEILPYVASMAYERKTGKEFNYAPRFNYLTFSNKDGWTQLNNRQ